MSAVFRPATPTDLDALLRALDEQFVYGKGRTHSLRVRFPSVFAAENAKCIFLCEDQGGLLSALAVRPFVWWDTSRSWHGAMVGAVYTDPARRGEGHASRLLDWALRRKRWRVDFGVLWTAQPEFYARLGWQRATGGGGSVYGEVDGSAWSTASLPSLSPASSMSEVTVISLAVADAAQLAPLERARRHGGAAWLPRQIRHYRHIPLPAEAVDAFVFQPGGRYVAHALVGRTGKTGIVYEMVGDAAGFFAVWREICRQCERVLVNDCMGSASYAWLSCNAGVQWQAKPLTMWRALSANMQESDLARWHFPYYDRI